MGVRGLFGLLDSYRRIYREVRFRRSRLVIDGCNLLYQLYFSAGLDEIHGGEYSALEERIQRFITALRDCGITPYVVLDGGSDPTDRKLETVTQRARDRIRKAHQAAVGQVKRNILPVLAMLVFKQTLVRLEVQVAQCYGEADQEIAALANEWRCPVLSNDSDFYIFGLGAGVLPTSHFRWEAAAQSGSQRFIPCLSYNASSFCIFFDIQPDLLPTFAALAGNDYVKLQGRGSPIEWSQFCPPASKTPNHLEGLLCWLKTFRKPQEAVEAVLQMLGEVSEEKRAEVLQGLWLGIKDYRLPPSSLKKFFIHGVAPTFPATGDVAAHVPDWMCLPLTRAELSGDIVDVLLLRRLSLNTLVDHADLPSACLTSRPLRQVMYRLLLGTSESSTVIERDREGLALKYVPVQPVAKGALCLQRLDKVEPSERLQVILEALGVSEESLNQLSPQLRLPVAVTCYWLQNAQPPPDETLVKALLLGLSNGDMPRRRAEKPKTPKSKLDVAVAHSFNQWQVCLKDSISLNLLLGCPLPDPRVARLYKGTLVHQLVGIMATGQKLKPFLKSDRSSVEQYHSLLSAVHQFHTRHSASSSETQNKETAPQQRQKQREPLDDLTANLQQLFFQHEDQETEDQSALTANMDLDLNQKLLVRTRYRTKERRNRCKNPELARKEECRGWDQF